MCVLAENFATHRTGGPSLVSIQVPLEGHLLPKLSRADFAQVRVIGIALAAITFVVIDFANNKNTLVTRMQNLTGALAQLIHIDVLFVCEQLSLASKSKFMAKRKNNHASILLIFLNTPD